MGIYQGLKVLYPNNISSVHTSNIGIYIHSLYSICIILHTRKDSTVFCLWIFLHNNQKYYK